MSENAQNVDNGAPPQPPRGKLTPPDSLARFYGNLLLKGMGKRTGKGGMEWKGKGGGMITRIRDVRTCQPR